MKPRNRRKLAVAQETLRQLSTAELAARLGGVEEGASGAECTRTCFACEIGTTFTHVWPCQV